ncbi:hypothetical protein BCR44DRAFT_39250 [Catenaria anguillulae PL171]|uniref:FAD-binding domain-containing protein n=1 Tax=Catenaria anguillulae PL171 TaxID=765915 RepID=A0A1Y2I450_9FUNG|nr:hypothetical protein BCR44DRAFT_39250 [Catenaria anguillulae PL171]
MGKAVAAIGAALRLMRLRMTVFSAVTYATAAYIGFSQTALDTDTDTANAPWTENAGLDLGLLVLGWIFVLTCQVSAHLLGEYYDLPSDRYAYLASPSPFTGGSRVLVSAAADAAHKVTPLTCKHLGQLTTLLALVQALAGLGWLDLAGREAVLFPLALAMIALAHQYSAPPLKLNHRALGELGAGVVMNLLLPYFGAILHLPNKVYLTNPSAAMANLHTSLAMLVIPSFLLKIALFMILNWADRRADFLGGKTTLALVLSPHALAHATRACMYLAYLSAMALAYFVPATIATRANQLGLACLLATLPLAHKLARTLHPSSRSLAPSAVFLALKLAPLPVLGLFFAHLLAELAASPAQTLWSPAFYLRTLPVLPFVKNMALARGPPYVQPLPPAAANADATDDRVVIVGGGVAGLLAALELDMRGSPVVVLERRVGAQVADRGADLGLWPTAVDVLKRWIKEPAWWLANAYRIAKVDVVALPKGVDARAWPLRQVDMEEVTDRGGFYLVVRQALMQRLREEVEARGIDVRYGAKVVRVTETRDHASVEYEANGMRNEVIGKLVIGADGVSSVCRRAIRAVLSKGMGVDNDDDQEGEPRYAGEVCYRGVIDLHRCPNSGEVRKLLDAVGDNVMPLVMGVGIRASWSYINEDRSVACWWVKEKMDQRLREQEVSRQEDDPGQDQLVGGWGAVRKAYDQGVEWPHVLRTLQDATRTTDLYLQDIIDRSPNGTPWCTHRIVLVGDAAHPVTPNMGQGATMAIEDVDLLVRLMDAAPHQVDAFIEYVRWRRPHASQVAGESYKQAKAGQVVHPVGVRLRWWLLGKLPRFVFDGRLKSVNMFKQPTVPKSW